MASRAHEQNKPVTDELRRTLDAVWEGEAHENKRVRALVTKSANVKFALALISTLEEDTDLDCTMYALRNTNILSYPGTNACRVTVGETVYYTYEYEHYSRPVLATWVRTFEQLGYELDNFSERSFTIKGIARDEFTELMETYGLVIFSDAPVSVQKPQY